VNNTGVRRATGETSASRILFNRHYKGRPKKIARLRESMADLALGDKIRSLREQAHLTQAQLARKIGTQASQISRIEDADYEAHSVVTLRRIAMALHKNLRIEFVEQAQNSTRQRESAMAV
jgi:ribosome-binding protein aMBF1 (putative translation factor)